METINTMMESQNFIHIFGYGSLTWKPDFESDRQFVGCIKGYERRFWQASHYHRGTPEKPGRVLTLTKVADAVCWGLVFEVRGQDRMLAALNKLQIREQDLGGYEVGIVPAFPSSGEVTGPVLALVYHALPNNDLFLGEAPSEDIAHDILTSCGEAGHNIEYLVRLVDFLRENVPGVSDRHLFEVDDLVREKIGLSKRQDPLTWDVLMRSPTFRSVVESQPIRDANYCPKTPLCKKVTLEALGDRRISVTKPRRLLSRRPSAELIAEVKRRRMSSDALLEDIEILFNINETHESIGII